MINLSKTEANFFLTFKWVFQIEAEVSGTETNWERHYGLEIPFSGSEKQASKNTWKWLYH